MSKIYTPKKIDANLLIAEDDPVVCENIKKYCENFFNHIFTAQDGMMALDVYLNESPEVILADIELPSISGLELVSKIRKIDEKCLIFIVSGHPRDHYLLEAIPLKLEGFLLKPLSSFKMDNFLKNCWERLYKTTDFTAPSNTWSYSYAKKCFFSDGKIIPLTHYEIFIFEILLQHKNTFLLYETIEDTLHHDVEFSKNTLRTLVSRMRKKAPFLNIISKQNIGYCLNVDH